MATYHSGMSSISLRFFDVSFRIFEPRLQRIHYLVHFFRDSFRRGLSGVAVFKLIEFQPGAAAAVSDVYDCPAILESVQA